MHVQVRATAARTGIPFIDAEHQRLESLAQQAVQACRRGDHDGVAAIVGRALALASNHFEELEQYLLRAGYHRVIEVRRAHEALMVSLEELADSLAAHRADAPARVEAVRDYLDRSFSSEAANIRRFLDRAA